MMNKLVLFSALLLRFQASSEAFVCHSGRGLLIDSARQTNQCRIHPKNSLLNYRNVDNSLHGGTLKHQSTFPWGSRAAGSTSKISLSALSAPTPSAEGAPFEKPKKASKAIKIWVHLLSVFVIVSYLQPLNLPEGLSIVQTVFLEPLFALLSNFIALVPAEVWSLIHAISGMVFGGSILCTTFVEWMWPDELEKMLKDSNVTTTTQSMDDLSLQILINKMATQTLFPMEGKLVLPGVTGSMISGIAQSFYNYGSLRLAPRHVKSSLHLMFLFGLWWAFTDRKSQEDLLKLSTCAQKDSGPSTREEMVQIWKRRRLFNSISCIFVVALYGMMVIKP
jgi:hypothetical protein